MTAFGTIPPEPPRVYGTFLLAPLFASALDELLDYLRGLGYPPLVFETLRTNERQQWLYNFGRAYDDGRGTVTKAPDAYSSWHGYGLAADVIHRDRYWNAPSFFRAMREALPAFGLNYCTKSDWPHVQFGGKMRRKPSPNARKLFEAGGLEAVWRAVHAITT